VEKSVRANRIRKSVGAENTFASDLKEFGSMAAELQPLIDKVWQHCESSGNKGRTVKLKIKFADFEIISQSFPEAISGRCELELASIALLERSMPLPKAVRLLGVSLSALQKEYIEQSQMALLL
jgi:DNA polymerase-4